MVDEDEVDRTIASLVAKGFVERAYKEDGEEVFSITDAGWRYLAESMGIIN